MLTFLENERTKKVALLFLLGQELVSTSDKVCFAEGLTLALLARSPLLHPFTRTEAQVF